MSMRKPDMVTKLSPRIARTSSRMQHHVHEAFHKYSGSPLTKRATPTLASRETHSYTANGGSHHHAEGPTDKNKSNVASHVMRDKLPASYKAPPSVNRPSAQDKVVLHLLILQWLNKAPSDTAMALMRTRFNSTRKVVRIHSRTKQPQPRQLTRPR
jgi:hypothetical protein